MNKKTLTNWLLFTFLLALGSMAGAASKSQAGGPVEIVQTVYSYHLGHQNSSAEKTIRSYRQYFAPALYKLLVKEWSKPSNPEEVSEIDWDILTASQDFPTSFKVEKARLGTDGTAKVEVRFLWSAEKSTVEIHLLRTKDGWQISDLYYPSEKQYLSDQLRSLNGKK